MGLPGIDGWQKGANHRMAGFSIVESAGVQKSYVLADSNGTLL